MDRSYKFNFTNQEKPGYHSVTYDVITGAPLYDSSVGYGFVNETSAMPPREVHTATITSDGTGFYITEPVFFAEPNHEKDNYNNYGMAFRIQAPPGAYSVYVKTTSDAADTTVSVSGMQTSRLLRGGSWDSARLVPKKYTAAALGKEWTYTYVNGRNYLDIEIEPNKTMTPVGIEEIVLQPILPEQREDGTLPTIFILGDSTVKSYIFNETPMSGWGQVIDPMFNLRKVNVINYSMGGRSFKSAYTEGRINDILMSGRIGDYLFIQFGHNDESIDEFRRFGRGATEAMYETYIKEIYLPAIRARGMIPVLVTPMSRVRGDAPPGYIYTNSFKNRKFPDIMKRSAEETGVTLIDLNSESIKYYNEIGVEATTAIIMSIEAGETPGMTSVGSYANGHPSNKIDGTHFKEALAKQFARIIVTELVKMGKAGDTTSTALASYLKEEVTSAALTGDWSEIFSEMAGDTTTGEAAYYRNQIEKLIQLNVMSKDLQGNFNPDMAMTVNEFILSISKLMNLEESTFAGYPNGELSREIMGTILDDAYHAKFTSKPKYMTDYNGASEAPGDPCYDPYVDPAGSCVMYYPLVSWDQLTDTAQIAPHLVSKVKDAYELGLIRSEKGIARGQMVNGTELEPKVTVTREKAAKALYFMWVLQQAIDVENDVLPNTPPVTTLSSYIDGQYLNVNTPTFTWSFSDADAGDAQRAYQVQGSTDNWQTTAFDTGEAVGTGTSYEAPAMQDNDNWSIRIRTMDTRGAWSEWAYRRLAIDTTAPTAKVEYSTTAMTNQDVIATIEPNEQVTITNNNGASSYTFSQNGSFTFEFMDRAGNAGTVIASVNNIDKTAPTLDIVLDKTTLFPVNHQLETVNASVYADDGMSQIDSVVLMSITSNEADEGLGDGDQPNDIQGAEYGTLDTSFMLRAERAGTGSGRVYTITYTATDKVGNKTTVSVIATVPRDQSNE
ncbi:GDSL-type esterase/lipase family protein [Paenibacillus tarimensis]